MTYTDVVNRVANILNRTSVGDLARIGLSINDRFREVMSGIGLKAAVNTTASANTVIGSRSVTFTCEKVFAVYDPAVTPARYLDERTLNELKNSVSGTQPPYLYAIQVMGASTVTIYLDCVPTTIFALGVDCEIAQADMSGVMVPAFPADFHDILVKGGIADELNHMEKDDLAKIAEGKFEKRLGELRYFMAKSGYLRIYQGKTGPDAVSMARVN